uniref:Uncharacterized protein n=1 Tax=Kalanchoe fedtschenkoi TaxID=63787 RepID=A0A7N0VEM4_KALFE
MESGGGPFTSPLKSNPLQSQEAEENESLTVVMPGDQIAKFIAMPCPCRPPRLLPENKAVAKHQKLPQTALPLQ